MGQVIAFRADASLQIGTGHVMRCLTLADALREQGAECMFICRPHAAHLLDLIAQRGHKAVALPGLPANATTASGDTGHADWLGTDWSTDAADTLRALGNKPVDWLVVDHYALDAKWERALRPACRRLMTIDDLADRSHDCDLLLDQNLGRHSSDYASHVPLDCTLLIGPHYALLRPEFSALRAQSLARRKNPQLKRLLITMGGVDKDNATGQVLDALKNCALPADCEITVVMGPHAPWLQQVQAQAKQMPHPTQVLAGVSNMAQLMSDSDLAIGAAGSTSWERCCLGLPCILMVLAENQKDGAAALQESGAAIAVPSTAEIANLFQEFTLSSTVDILLRRLSKAAEEVTDGQGTTLLARQLISNHA